VLSRLGEMFNNALATLNEIDQEYPRAGFYRNKWRERFGSSVRERTDELGNLVVGDDGKAETYRLDKDN